MTIHSVTGSQIKVKERDGARTEPRESRCSRESASRICSPFLPRSPAFTKA